MYKILALSICLAGIAFFSIKGFNTAKESQTAKVSVAADSLPKVDLEQYEKKLFASLPGLVKDTFLINQFKNPIKPDNISTAKSAVVGLDSLSLYHYSAILLFKIAEFEKTDSAFNKSGKYFLNAASLTNDPELQQYLLLKAEKAYENAYNFNNQNMESNLYYAICLIENQNAIMKAVPLLKAVEEKEPENEDAIFILARLSVESGQYEKAMERYNKLLTLRPANAEYLFSISELYSKMNDTIKAKEYLNKAIQNNK